MTVFNFPDYIKDVAERHQDILHSDSSRHYFRIGGIGQLDQFLSKINVANSPAICVDVNPDGQVISSSDNNSVDITTYRFLVIYSAKSGNFESIEDAKSNAKLLGLKILGKLKNDKYRANINNVDNGLTHLDLNFQYQVVGPLAQNWYGCMFTLRIQQSATDAGMKFDADEYSG
jgi:hypothetical protein